MEIIIVLVVLVLLFKLVGNTGRGRFARGPTACKCPACRTQIPDRVHVCPQCTTPLVRMRGTFHSYYEIANNDRMRELEDAR